MATRRPFNLEAVLRISSIRSACLDLPEVHRPADQFVVLWQLLPGRQLDENLAELSPAGAAGSDLISAVA